MTRNAHSREPIREIMLTPRSLTDYRDMFDLAEEDLARGPILDCAAGASPFGAQVRAAGGRVVSVDPRYEDSIANLRARARADIAESRRWSARNPGSLDWDYLGGPEELFLRWEQALERFAADYSPDGARYVAAALPELPFPDRHFALSVSGYYLFLYPSHVSFERHLSCIRELVRVTDGEVRIAPLIDTALNHYPWLGQLRAALDRAGVRTAVQLTRGSYHPGGNTVLICRRASA